MNLGLHGVLACTCNCRCAFHAYKLQQGVLCTPVRPSNSSFGSPSGVNLLRSTTVSALKSSYLSS
jgi:hypothetical protein